MRVDDKTHTLQIIQNGRKAMTFTKQPTALFPASRLHLH